MFRGLYKALKITRDDIGNLILNNTSLSEEEKEMALIDFDEALNFYRGNPLIDVIGSTLKISCDKLDKFFEDGNYEHLLVL